MLESKIQKKIIKFFMDNGTMALKFESPGKVGVPDLICLGPAGAFFVEVKQPTGRLSKIQEHVIEEMRGYNARVYIATSTEDCWQIIEAETR